MLDAARKAVRRAAGRSREDLEAEDGDLADLLTRPIEIIGEAATHVSAGVQKELGEIPWTDIIGMRNRLIHAYVDINLDILWATVQDSLPVLIQRLELALSEDESRA